MPQVISDARITAMIAEPKRLPQDWQRQLATLRDRPGGNESDSNKSVVDVRGAAGGRFQVIVRQHQQRPNDFSVILMARTTQRPEFRLLRYDGGNHRHRNKIEGYWLERRPHIHRATARYQRAAARHPTGGYDHDGFAFEVQRYRDLAGAWDCFFEDVRLELPAGSSTKALPPVFA